MRKRRRKLIQRLLFLRGVLVGEKKKKRGVAGGKGGGSKTSGFGNRKRMPPRRIRGKQGHEKRLPTSTGEGRKILKTNEKEKRRILNCLQRRQST